MIALKPAIIKAVHQIYFYVHNMKWGCEDRELLFASHFFAV